MQLLKITNIPIEYKIRVDPARLEMSHDAQRDVRVETRPARLNMRSENIKVQLDSKDMRRSIGLRGMADVMSDSAQKGMEAVQKLTDRFVKDGNQMAQIDKKITIPQVYAQHTQEQLQAPVMTTSFLPSAPIHISWQKNQLDAQYVQGELNYDWQAMRNAMDFVPGKFQMDILQYPKVMIEYLGKPNYVPPSADPTYEEN